MSELYASVTGCTGITYITINDSHNNSTRNATIDCRNCTLNLGDYLEIDLGYTDNHRKLFSGYIKQVEKKTPDNTFSITASDLMIRAIDYFIVPTNPNDSLKYRNIKAEDVVRNIMALAGLSTFYYDETYFTFGVNNEFEVKLISSYDYSRMIGDLLTWSIWCDQNGAVHFENRKPYVMHGDTGQPGDSADIAIAYTLYDPYIVSYSKIISEKNLRNRIVVWGSDGVYAVAEVDSPYLPDGFRKSALLSAPDLVTDNGTAQQIADYNLNLLNRITTSINTTVVGDPLLEARKVIHTNVNLPGSSENRDFYVFTAEHSWGKQGYTTNLDLRL